MFAISASALFWWLRSASSATTFRGVYGNGSDNNGYANFATGVALGFCLGLESETITDSWTTILANTNPSAMYSIGDTKSISINGENHLMQIVAFNADEKRDGSGTAKISWLMKDLLSTAHRMNATSTNVNGWPATEMRSWLRDTILPTIDSSIRNYIVDVNKTYYDYTDKTTETSSDNIWLASAREMFGGSSYESSGVMYTTIFKDATSRIKKRNNSASDYWLRSARSGTSAFFRRVGNDGDMYGNGADYSYGVCVGFCTD